MSTAVSCVSAIVLAGALSGAVTVDPLDYVRAELAKGVRHVVVPHGTYVVSPKDRAGHTYLHLAGRENLTIDFSGSELRGTRQTGFFRLDDCTNVTIRNVTLDFCELPFTQARIVSSDAEGTQELETVAGYPKPTEAEFVRVWPFQVYDGKTFEIKNFVRSDDGFKLERIGDGRYRVTGGRNRTGDVGDIAVWGMPPAKGTGVEGDHVSERDMVYARRTVHCVFEDITEYATPGGRAFEEHLSEGNVYRCCAITRRPPETDFEPRGVRRLRSGNHDAFMSRRATVGPKLIGCTALYHCDDALNITGMTGVVYDIRGNEVRVLEYTPTVFAVGDTAQAMTPQGASRPRMRVTGFRRGEGLSAQEREYLSTIGLWPGLDGWCKTSCFVTLDDASALRRGDAIVSDRAQGNGFEIRGCHFGRNRAHAVRLRASNGVIADNLFDRCEGRGVFIGPEYEWMEGGLSENIVVENNRFEGCTLEVGGTAAFRKRLPRSAYRNIVERNNTIRP